MPNEALPVSHNLTEVLSEQSGFPALPRMAALKGIFDGNSIAAQALKVNQPDFSALKGMFDGSSIDVTRAIKSSIPNVSLLMGIQSAAHTSLFDVPSYSAFSTIRSSLKDILDANQTYPLPQVAEIQSAFHAYQSDHAMFFKSGELKTYLLDRVSASLESMQMSSLDVINSSESIKGVLDVHRMASIIDRFSPYSVKTEAFLRNELGDWRDAQAWPSTDLEKELSRSSFYADRGLDRSLTAFKPAAFEALAESSGLRSGAKSLAQLFGDPVPSEGHDEEVLSRSTEAYGYLMRFEQFIRKTIDEAMTREFGEDWPRHQLPNGLFDKWSEKKTKAEREGAPRLRLIEYADFTDYSSVIGKQDNWKRVFVTVFRTIESIRESLQRLQPVRICVMHSRQVTNDDMLFLYVEIKRITNAFAKR